MSILDNARFWDYIYFAATNDKAVPDLPQFTIDGRRMRIYADNLTDPKRTPLFGGGDAYTTFAKFWVSDLFRFEPTIRIFRYFQDPGEPHKPTTYHMLDKELFVHPYSTQEEVDHALLMIALTITVPDDYE